MWAGAGADALVTGINNIVSHFARKKAARKEWKHFKNRYQVAVADLRAAGLAPSLMFGSAQPGIPPSGEAMPPPGGIMQGMEGSGQAIAEAVQSMKERNQQLSNARQAGVNLRHEEDLLMAQIDETWSRSGQAAANTANMQAHTRLTDLQRKYAEIMLPWEARLMRSRIPGAEAEAGFYEDIGKGGPWMRFLFNMGNVLRGRAGAGAPRGRGEFGKAKRFEPYK